MKREQVKEINAVLYARVSSDEQQRGGYSIPAQEKLLRSYGVEKGLHIVKEYVDVETAKAAGRTGFGEMVDFLKQQSCINDPSRRCRTILVEKTDRLYRNLSDYATLGDLDLDIHLVKEGDVLSNNSHSSAKFMHGIKVLMAKQYIDNLSEETRKGLQEKAEQGIWPLRSPLGYIKAVGPSGKKVDVPDPAAAALIRSLFERYVTGTWSLEELVESARADGLLFPNTKTTASRSYVHSILTNPFYCGRFRWKKQIYDGVHKPLVSRELWGQVQEVLRRRGVRRLRKVKHTFAFSGLITCSHCGCALVGEIQKQRYVYYHCTGNKGSCGEPYVREEVLEERFAEALGRLRFSEDILAWVTEALRDSHRDEQRLHSEAVDRLQREYKRLQDRLDNMYVDKLDGKIPLEFYDKKSGEWRDEQSALLHDLERHQQANQSYVNEGVALLELASRAESLFRSQPAAEKRKLLDFVCSNSRWGNGVLALEFRQPFDLIADGASLSVTEEPLGGELADLCPIKGG